MMDLRSLLQDVLSEVSSEVISFHIELHSLITWVKSSGLFQDYRIFEDMHHGITIHQEFEKNKNYMYALWVWGVLKFLFQMLYAWVCFNYGMHEFYEVRSERYHT